VASVRTARARQSGLAVPAAGAACKVPEITALFWIIKVLTTAQGEAVADFLYFRYGPVITGTLGTVGLAAALAVQFRVRRYVPWIYWLAVMMVAVFGTLAADGLHIVIGVPYLWSTALYGSSLAVIFALWYVTERTLSIHSIFTWRREAFYWATVMATFALGTALGDLTAYTMHLGYLTSGLLFAAVIAIPAVAHWRFGLNPILAFWFAYVVTRPLGASFADWLGVSHALGGLGLGRGPVGLSLTIVIAGFVGYLSGAGEDIVDHGAVHSRPLRSGRDLS
jgi:uncharacterized membrane-anchored protein